MFVRDYGLQIWEVATEHNFQKILEIGSTVRDLIFQEKTTTTTTKTNKIKTTPHSSGNPWKAVLFSDVPPLAVRNWVAAKLRVFKTSWDFDTGDLFHLGSRSLRLLKGRQDHLGFDFDFFWRVAKKSISFLFSFCAFQDTKSRNYAYLWFQITFQSPTWNFIHKFLHSDPYRILYAHCYLRLLTTWQFSGDSSRKEIQPTSWKELHCLCS